MVITVEPGCYFNPALLKPALEDNSHAAFLVKDRVVSLLVGSEATTLGVLHVCVCYQSSCPFLTRHSPKHLRVSYLPGQKILTSSAACNEQSLYLASGLKHAQPSMMVLL